MAYLSSNGVYVSSDYGNIFNPTTLPYASGQNLHYASGQNYYSYEVQYNLVNVGFNNLIISSAISNFGNQNTLAPVLIYKVRCAAGSYIGNHSCTTCPLKYYSSTPNSESCSQCPYSAMTTPSTGTTDENQCFNPISSFLLAIVSFMIAPFLVLVYFMKCRIHFVSFIRVQLVIKRLQITMSLFSKYLKEIGSSLNLLTTSVP